MEALSNKNKGKVLLRAEGLERKFGGLTAVADFSFELREGEILGLIGPNGAGKSTTFNLISGFMPPTSGSLSFLDQNITSKNATHISRMGLIRTFQHESLLSEMSVADNIIIATTHRLKSQAARLEKMQETAKLTGLEDHLEVMAGSLPHGLQRMLSIAIALAAEPKVLCLDEPLTGLQGAEVGAALDLFEMIRSELGITILLVEHNMRAVMRICDRILVLNHGRLLAAGTPEEVSQNQLVIEAYLGHKK
ncbi:MAG: ABC transporter ATP-binding protein [Sneathiella sp.]|uniref:ABC transporter ATP-binding protein n=1 Tax=Sneathiella sp. TaxID=1964365 RepID=UPI000C6C1E15|nr:ABC transporter ATP-binding protein [Sneathiella sp.]|tara:strand:- start:409 stop:1158 length:750 start_codon:yes stop_codon:yes gene_type:complete